MTEVATLLDQLRQLYVQHAPTEMLSRGAWVGVIFLVAGVGLSVLGAKFARFGLTSAFVVAGGLGGQMFGEEVGFPPIVCVLIGAFLVGIIAFQTFRLWVGVGAAIVFSSMVMGTFGYHRLVPHVTSFQNDRAAAVVSSPQEEPVAFALPTPADQQAYLDRTPKEWAQSFWAYLTEQDYNTARYSQGLAVLALLTGLSMGLLAVRWALILSTSLLGTSMVTTGLATLLTQSVPDSYQAFQNNPKLVGIGIGAFLATSLVLQTMLSRKAALRRRASSDEGGERSTS